MRKLIGLCIAAALLPTSALAAPGNEKGPAFLAEQYREAGGRAVLLTIEQSQIETSFDLGRVPESLLPPESGFWGWYGAPAVRSMDEDRRNMLSDSLHRKAEANAVPLRQALLGFDVDALALAATKAGLAKPGWFQMQDITASRDPLPQSRAAFFASSATPQSAFINYRYELSPDFTQIRVMAEIAIERPVPAKPGKAALSQVIYRQRLLSIVQLRSPSYEPRENVTRWSASGGALARQALTAAFGQFEEMLPYVLGLGQADLDGFAAKDREKSYAAGFYGPLIARKGPEDVLIWSSGLVHVQAMP
jgi:hypothetical protein